MRIAHRIPVSVDPTRALAWLNLFGSCDGGERSGGLFRMCDAAQGETELTIDPTSAVQMAQLSYEPRDDKDGLFIKAADPVLRHDLEETLNLNDPELASIRARQWERFLVQVKARYPGEYGKPARRKLLAEHRAMYGTTLPEWFGLFETMTR
jgi:hypothetical protein